MRTRRAFLVDGSLLLAGAGFSAEGLAAWLIGDPPAEPSLRIGLLADVHYAEKDRVGSRCYRDSLMKVRGSVERLNELGVDHLVELGDFIDTTSDSVEAEIDHLRAINAEFASCKAPRHYVLGNHCVDLLTKDEFLGAVGAERPHYSFDAGGGGAAFHFVILDACYRADGTPYGRRNGHWQDTRVPPEQVRWLQEDLSAAKHPSIVFVHQRLDDTEHYSVRNAADVRAVLEGSGRVIAVFQGHSHKNEYRRMGSIPYCVIRAMVEEPGPENNAFAGLELFADGSIRIRGFARQRSYDWSEARAG